MNEFGIENVRGACFAQLVLPPHYISVLTAMFAGVAGVSFVRDSKLEGVVYVLKLEGGKYCVGIADGAGVDCAEHARSSGAAEWLRLHVSSRY